MADKKMIPTGVKIISVLYWIGAILMILFGIISLLGAGVAASFLEDYAGMAALGAGLFVVLGVVLIVLGILGIFIALGLWKGRNWARIIAGILAILGVINSLLALFSGEFMSIVYIVIHGIIAWYLLFNENVKKAMA